MREQTVYFLQALSENGISQDNAMRLAKKTFLYDKDQLLYGLWKDETVWVSEEAKELKRQMTHVIESVAKVPNFTGFLRLLEQFDEIYGKLQALQVITVQAITSPNGPSISDVHIILPSIARISKNNIIKQMKYQLYRLLVLGKPGTYKPKEKPKIDQLTHWIQYYKDVLQPQLDSQDNALDGRWSYEKKQVVLFHHFYVEQFVAVKPVVEEIHIIPGKCQVSVGTLGRVRISGRGLMTNMTPDDVFEQWGQISQKHLPENLFFRAKNVEGSPESLLREAFGTQKYIVDPQEYFRRWNEYLIAKTVYERSKRSQCIYCGEISFERQCKKCGEYK